MWFLARNKADPRYRDRHGQTLFIATPIILIDGRQLVQLMIEHDVGVSTVASYEIKRIDQDYFTEA